MKEGDLFVINGADSDVGLHSIRKGYVDVGHQYKVTERDGNSPCYWFVDNTGHEISTVDFVITCSI